MRNVEMDVNKNVLTIKIDLNKRFGPSKSGKTEVVASTEGFCVIVPGVVACLNVNAK